MVDYLTLSPKNQFTFDCPIFNTETKMAVCTAIREKVWMGKRIYNKEGVEVRTGCQAAMRCGMCPAAEVVKQISYGKGRVSDDHGSLEPKKGKLHASILERVVNVSPVDTVIKGFALSDDQRELLFSARGRIADQLKTAPGSKGKTAFIEPKKSSSKPVTLKERRKINSEDGPAIDQTAGTKTTSNEAINHAARTGDLAAALNAA